MNDRSREITGPAGLPEQFAHYRIVRRLGQGGMGTVYLAEDQRLDRKVALKVCHLGKTPQAVSRFRREAKAAAALRHPNLCPIYDFDVHDGTPYFTMAFIDGPTLDQWMTRRGGVTPREAVVLVHKLARALQAAHAEGVVHRDLKPSNIAIDRGEPIVLDFGLARVAAVRETKLTAAGEILGTPSYMAPEQVTGDVERIGPATDVYSLGVVLYEMLTGRLPFEGPLAAVLGHIMLTPPPPPREVRPELDPTLEAICLKALAKDPAARYASMNDFAAALAGWAKGHRETETSLRSAPAAPTDQRATASRHTTGVAPLFPMAGRRKVVAASVVGLAFLTALGSWIAIGHRGSDPNPESPSIALNEAPSTDPVDPPTPDVEAVPPAASNPPPRSLPRPVARPTPPRPVGKLRELTNSVGMRLVEIPPGKFIMGSPTDEPDRGEDETQHEVEITRSFWLGAFEVTRRQYVDVTGKVPLPFRGGEKEKQYRDELAGSGDYPVVAVLWDQAQEFCALLSKLPAERDAGRVYRLPTEAEWEYACREGGAQPGPFAFGTVLTREQANVGGVGGARHTLPVGSLLPNAWGLFDMHGNVHEWCADPYAPNYGGLENARDPKGPAFSPRRVHRGGSYIEPAAKARSAARHPQIPNVAAPNLGFRVACTVESGTTATSEIDLRLMDQKIAANPNFAGHYNERGFYHMRQKDYDKAIADFTDLIRLNEQIPFLNGYHHRATVHLEKGDFAAALADLDKAIDWAPENSSLFRQRATVHEKLNQPEKAAEDRRLADEREKDVHAHQIRAMSKLISEQRDDRAYMERAWHYMHYKQYTKALLDFDELVRRQSRLSDVNSYFERGRAYREMGDYPRALADLNRAIERDPRNPECYNHRRAVYEKMGEKEKAAADAAKVRELRENSSK